MSTWHNHSGMSLSEKVQCYKSRESFVFDQDSNFGQKPDIKNLLGLFLTKVWICRLSNWLMIVIAQFWRSKIDENQYLAPQVWTKLEFWQFQKGLTRIGALYH